MRTPTSALILILLISGLSACSKPKIDTSTDRTLAQSIDAVRKALPAKDRDAFNDALKVIALDNVSLTTPNMAAAVKANYKAHLAGKTADQVIAEAAKIIAERQKRERKQAVQEIKELRAKKAAAEKAKLLLSKFQVLRSRFYKQEQEYGMPQPVIDLTVKNGTHTAISRAYFLGVIASPGRAVPWLKEEFNYEIPGGLEPGEQAHWTLAPNEFSKWGNVDVPKDAILTVTVERLDGPDGNSILSGKTFSDEDAARLQQLIQHYGSKEQYPAQPTTSNPSGA